MTVNHSNGFLTMSDSSFSLTHYCNVLLDQPHPLRVVGVGKCMAIKYCQLPMVDCGQSKAYYIIPGDADMI